MHDSRRQGNAGETSFPETPMRINKFLARAGYCSRRQADEMVRAGRVTIDGRVAGVGETVHPGDTVCVDGRPVVAAVRTVLLAFHKPRGVVTTTDPGTPNNIMTLVDYPVRVFPVGRLDQYSSGLIFLTNDGDLARRILDPASGHEKEYVVRLDRPYPDALLERLSKGVVLDGRPTRPCVTERLGRRSFRMVLTEGRNRQIRRMCEACGYRVVGLRRIRIMNVALEDLPPGRWREIDPGGLFVTRGAGSGQGTRPGRGSGIRGRPATARRRVKR